MLNILEKKILEHYDFADIMATLLKSFGARRLVLRVPVHEESEIFKTIYDNRGELLEEKRDVLSAYYMSHNQPEFIVDFTGDIFRSSDILDSNVKGALIVPVLFSGRVVGIMHLLFDSYDNSEQLLTRINNLLPFISLLVAYRLKELELSESALLDRLTNLPSATYFWQRVDEEYRRARRYSRKFSLMLIDIDNLRDINEKYGPRTTDKLLRKFAELLKKHFRSTDIVTRFGGDEFAVILPETGLQNIYQVAEGFRLRVMSTPFEIEFGPTLNITVTTAVVNYPSVPLDPDALLEKLLLGLKEAKSEGGNRTMLINY